ncbi:MAG TPA: recombinase family protein [Chloroflexota bacterium]
MLITALLYVRVSSDEQAREGLSIPTQLAECRRYAAGRGWVLGAEYVDVLSGTRDDRPQYQRLLADVRALRAQGVAVVIVVAALDRFGRRLLERVRSRDELKALGVPVHAVREGGEVSDLVANILGSVAQEEVRRLGERVHANRAFLAERGWHLPGNAPWGYRWRAATDDERTRGSMQIALELDPLAAPSVRTLFTLVADGSSVRAASRWARALPAGARGGRRLSHQAVLGALRNATYVARAPAQWPAIVDEDTFGRVARHLADHVVHAHQASGRYLLTGFLRCPRCGGRVYGSTHRGARHYRCAVEHPGGRPSCGQWDATAAPLERAVLAEVAAALAPFRSGSRELRGRLERAWRRQQTPDETAAARATRRATLEREIARAEAALVAAGLKLVADDDRHVYELVRADQTARLQAARAELAKLPAVVAPAPPVALERVLAELPSWLEVLAAAPAPEQRRVLAQLVVEVEPERIGRARWRVAVAWTAVGALLRGEGEKHRGWPVGPDGLDNTGASPAGRASRAARW